jgi:hypothetical protein
LSLTLNVDSDDDWVTACDRLFQTRAAAAGNARSPIVDRFVMGKTSAVVDADRRRRPETVSGGVGSANRWSGSGFCLTAKNGIRENSDVSPKLTTVLAFCARVYHEQSRW